MSNDSRNEILSKIAAVRSNRAAAIDSQTTDTTEIYKPILPDPVTCFINELEAINGKCFLCENETEIFKKLKLFTQTQNIKSIFCRDSTISKQLAEFNIPFSDNPADFDQMRAGITSCEYLVARTGSVIVSSASESGRQMNVFPPIHIVIAKTNQITDYLTDALAKMQIKYGNEFPSTISTITGPSRTADIEKTLVLGAHGPKEFIVFLSKT
jgi:L-lactate dehydrogenase complex protein LldG